MKNVVVKGFAIFGLFFMLAIVGVQAQTAAKVEVNIPFDFLAGTTKLKAGQYTVKRMRGNSLAIRSADGKTNALVNAPLTIGSRDSKAGERLVFNRYGDLYFLSQVWLTVESGRQIYPSSAEARAAREHKLATGKPQSQRVEIAVRGK